MASSEASEALIKANISTLSLWKITPSNIIHNGSPHIWQKMLIFALFFFRKPPLRYHLRYSRGAIGLIRQACCPCRRLEACCFSHTPTGCLQLSPAAALLPQTKHITSCYLHLFFLDYQLITWTQYWVHTFPQGTALFHLHTSRTFWPAAEASRGAMWGHGSPGRPKGSSACSLRPRVPSWLFLVEWGRTAVTSKKCWMKLRTKFWHISIL